MKIVDLSSRQVSWKVNFLPWGPLSIGVPKFSVKTASQPSAKVFSIRIVKVSVFSVTDFTLNWLNIFLAIISSMSSPSPVTVLGHGTGAACLHYLMTSDALPHGRTNTFLAMVNTLLPNKLDGVGPVDNRPSTN